MNKRIWINTAVLVILIGGGLSLVGFYWWMFRQNSGRPLGVIPTQITTPHVITHDLSTWKTFTLRGLSLKVPLDWGKISLTETEERENWSVLGNEKIALILRHPASLDFASYKTTLYTRWHPLFLAKKAMLLPPINQEFPQILEQKIGPWATFIFPSTNRWHFDLFRNGTYMSATFRARQRQAGTVLDEQLMKDIVSTISEI